MAKSRRYRKEKNKKKSSKQTRKRLTFRKNKRNDRQKGGFWGLIPSTGLIPPSGLSPSFYPSTNPLPGSQVVMTQPSMPQYNNVDKVTASIGERGAEAGLPVFNPYTNTWTQGNGGVPPIGPNDTHIILVDDNDENNNITSIQTIDEILKELGKDKQLDLDAYSTKPSEQEFNQKKTEFLDKLKKKFINKYGEKNWDSNAKAFKE
uniref:Uncharacterized protein n=1 Tax=viral metagenome TaxID=1070528 RepID=A0A6C0D3G7_9ZZZZ